MKIMELERRALYNSLRMNWLRDSAVKVEMWQVEDLRPLSTEELFQRLHQLSYNLDAPHFISLADAYDTPEELTDELLAEADLSHEDSDKCYLLFFELWRRLIPEKQSLSLFCDELDYQIHLYDIGQIQNVEAFQDIISQLLQILNDNADRGLSPKACMGTLLVQSANDIEQFLYDYLSEEIDQGNFRYAHDFVEGFLPFIQDKRWFELLALRLKVEQEEVDLEAPLQALIKRAGEEPLEFYFEIMNFLAKHGDPKSFSLVAKKALSQLKTEEDLADFLSLSADFHHLLDDETKEKQFLDILKGRNRPMDAPFGGADPVVAEIKKLF